MLLEPAADLLRAVVPETVLERSEKLSKRHSAEVYLKREDLQPVRSYKIRGAFCFIAALNDQVRQDGVVCASAGNHAQGVAWACRHFGIPATVFVPLTTPRQKIERIESIGGSHVEVRIVGDTFDSAQAFAQAHALDIKRPLVPPFDDEQVIAGQSTVTEEIIDAAPDVDAIVVPVGGGGLSAGAVDAIARNHRSIDLFVAEPAGAASLHLARSRGRPTPLEVIDRFVDGAAVQRVGDRPFERLRHLPDECVLAIEEGRVCQIIREFLHEDGIVLEPAGALSIAALEALDLAGRTVACVVSGGNLDLDRWPEIELRARRYEGRQRYWLLQLPQRPGALKEFVAQLGPDDDIVRFEYLKRSSRSFGSVLVGLQSPRSTEFEQLERRLRNAGYEFRDLDGDPLLAEMLL